MGSSTKGSSSSSSSSFSRGDVQHYIDFMRTMRMIRNGRPTFDQAINLAYIDPAVLSRPEENKVVYRYTIAPELLYLPPSTTTNHQNEPFLSLGTHVAVIDQITSCAMSLVRKSTTGVSVLLEAKHHSFPTSNQINVITYVTKMGRNLAFCRTEARDVNPPKALVCTGSHINFLKVGGGSGSSGAGRWLSDFLTSPRGFHLVKSYQETKRSLQQQGRGRSTSSKPKQQQRLFADIILPYLTFSKDRIGRATFQLQAMHENYSSGFHVSYLRRRRRQERSVVCLTHSLSSLGLFFVLKIGWLSGHCHGAGWTAARSGGVAATAIVAGIY